jgi:hypothetical protein
MYRGSCYVSDSSAPAGVHQADRASPSVVQPDRRTVSKAQHQHHVGDIGNQRVGIGDYLPALLGADGSNASAMYLVRRD